MTTETQTDAQDGQTEAARGATTAAADFSPPPVFVINLARSPERWQALQAQASAHAVPLTRVEAVDASALAPKASRGTLSNEWPGLDRPGFEWRNGRSVLAGEYGCYRSHLAALAEIVRRDLPFAVVAEDDVVLPADFTARLDAIVGAVPDCDVVKLVNHRVPGFVEIKRTRLGDRIGRCLFGPTGSSAAYLVSAKGARKLAARLAIMRLPYDVALERFWASDLRFYAVRDNLVGLGAMSVQSTLGAGNAYRDAKFKAWKRLPTLGFRTSEAARRAFATLTRRN